MKWRLAFSCCVVFVATVGCGGSNGTNTVGTGGRGGGGTAAGTGGTVAGSTAVGSGGTSQGVGGSGGTMASLGGAIGSGGSQADAGPKDAGSAIKLDARAATPDQTVSTGDAGATIGQCPSFTPCGGDLIGIWHLKSECLGTISSSGSCQVDILAMDISRYNVTFTFAAGGTVTLSSSGTFDETVRYSSGCLTGSYLSPEQTCSGMQDSTVQSFEGGADAGTLPLDLQKFECSLDSAGACICQETASIQIIGTSTYTVAGNQVTMGKLESLSAADAGSRDAGTEDPSDYCVSGDTLTLKLSSAVVAVLAR